MITSAPASQSASARQWFLARSDLDALVEAIRATGRSVIGPTVREGAIVYDDIQGAADLPAGWRDEQSAGRYRLERRSDEHVFGYTVGPTSWKRFTFPPNLTIATSHKASFGFEQAVAGARPVAFLGVRACELAALEIQDRVFLGSQFTDEDLPGPPGGRVHRGGPVHHLHQHLLLHLDGHGAGGQAAATTSS